MITLTGLCVYPVKSARGIPLDTAVLTEHGILHDRRFMVVDEAGQFLTQRKRPELARLTTAFESDVLALSFPGLGSEHVPLMPTTGIPRRVRVWDDEVDALELGAPLKRFLSAALGVDAALVYMPEAAVRVPSLEYAQSHDRVAFADGFPYLVANESSLTALRERAQQAIPMDRFRPNLVVSGAAAYAEDQWHEVAVGSARFELVKPCTRCVMTTTDQQTGERKGPEPLASLARDHTWQGQAAFAQNAVARELGTLRLGDAVRVISTRNAPC